MRETWVCNVESWEQGVTWNFLMIGKIANAYEMVGLAACRALEQ